MLLYLEEYHNSPIWHILWIHIIWEWHFVVFFFQEMFRQWFIVSSILLSNLHFLFIQWFITVFTRPRVFNANVWRKDSYVTHMCHEHKHTGEPYIQQINKPLSISIQKRNIPPMCLLKAWHINLKRGVDGKGKWVGREEGEETGM